MSLKERLERVRVMFEGTSLDSRLPPAYPPAAVEFSPDGIAGVRVARERRGGRPVIRAAAWRELPPGSLAASLIRPNILDAEAVGKALDEVLLAVAPGEHKVSLLLPDHAARVSLLSFAALPGTRKELAEMVRFRIAKGLPFKAEEAVMDLMPLSATGATATGSVLALFMHRPILEQYESLLTTRGYWPGLVGLSTLELFNLFRSRLDPGAHERDLLMLNLTQQYLALVILSAGSIIFYRCKPHAAGAPGGDFGGVRREIYTSLAFYQEKLLGRGLGRAWLRVSGLPAESAAAAVREEAGCPVEVLHLGEALPSGEGVAIDEDGMSRLAPAAGAVVGRRV
jgi:type IV pilus assembly protein PilM